MWGVGGDKIESRKTLAAQRFTSDPRAFGGVGVKKVGEEVENLSPPFLYDYGLWELLYISIACEE